MANYRKSENEVSVFLETLKHPLHAEIEELRKTILKSNAGLTENIKWNGPNFCFQGEDRVTMRLQPKMLQLIFHRGAKALKQPKDRLINDETNLLEWKANDRAVLTFNSMDEIKSNKAELKSIINKWLKATS